MKVLDEFARKVMVENNSFDVEGEDRNYSRGTMITYHFMQDYIGKAKYVYGHKFRKEDPIGTMKIGYDLVAIVCENIIYIVDEYFLSVLTDKVSGLPENVRLFDDAIKESNEYAKTSIFPKYCEGLSSDSITEEDKIGYDFDHQCLQAARSAIFNGKSSVSIEPPKSFLNADELVNILCGFNTLENIVLENLDKNRKNYEWKKCSTLKINELIKSGNVVKPYEVEIANGLNSIDAKSVTVEFEVNGKTASGKMDPDKIVYILCHSDDIDDYNFITCRQGKEVMKALDIKTYGADARRLYPSDITKITYGRKVLYKRKQAV